MIFMNEIILKLRFILIKLKFNESLITMDKNNKKYILN
jgi:hypothetical protein